MTDFTYEKQIGDQDIDPAKPHYHTRVIWNYILLSTCLTYNKIITYFAEEMRAAYIVEMCVYQIDTGILLCLLIPQIQITQLFTRSLVYNGLNFYQVMSGRS
jgi:hypothetical protein